MSSPSGMYGAMVLTVLCVLAPSGAANAQSFANRELRSSAALDKCVTAPPSASDNSQLLIQACNGSASQRFTLQPDGHLQAGVRNPQGYDLCVDYYPTQGAEGSPVRLFRCRPFGGGADSHRWSWDGSRLRGAHGTFVAPAGGEAALSGASAGLIMSASPGRSAQWVFDAPAIAQAPQLPALSTIPGRSVTFYSVHAPGKCIAPASGGGLILWDCVDNPNQRFDWLAEGHIRQGGRCVGNASDATRFEECVRNATHQQWVSDGGVIRNRNNPAQCLDIERGATANGTRILAFSCGGSSSNQRWSMQSVAAAAPAAPTTGGQQAGNAVPPLAMLNTPARLDAVEGLQAAAQSSAQLLSNLQVFADAVRAGASGAEPLFEAEAAASMDAAVRFLRHVLETSPTSLQKIAQGSVVALNQDERDLLNQMLAQDDLDHYFRDANTRLQLAMWNLNPALIVTETPFLMRSVAAQDPSDVITMRSLVERMKLTGLSRAESLVTQLHMARTLNSARIFADNFLLVESTVTAFVERIAEGRRGRLPQLDPVHTPAEYRDAHAKIAGAIKAYTLAKLAVQLSAATLNFIVAHTPTSLSGFYMTVNERRYQGRTPPAHVMKTGESVIARIYVIPRSAGGSVVTPLGVLGMVIDAAGVSPRLAQALSYGPLGTQIAQVYKDMAIQVARVTGKIHADTALTIAGNTGFSAWAGAIQGSIRVPARDHRPVEINDERVVKLTPGPAGAEHIRLGATPDRRFTITAVSKGVTGITGQLLLDDLLLGGGEKFLRIAIEVADAQQASPVPVRPAPGGRRPCGPPGALAFCEGNICIDVHAGTEWADRESRLKCQ